jgi:hypothetical protein
MLTQFRCILNEDVEHHCTFLEFRQKKIKVAKSTGKKPILVAPLFEPVPHQVVPVPSSAPPAPAPPSATPAAVSAVEQVVPKYSAPKRKRAPAVRETIAQRPADAYFLQRGGKVATSLRTLADAGLPSGQV